jgi:hypothetical protein
MRALLPPVAYCSCCRDPRMYADHGWTLAGRRCLVSECAACRGGCVGQYVPDGALLALGGG